ncbi:MAG: helix-turn-helix transcriptional regulator [Chloroflexi bacterium]|nr:helix-turn-helix transcriptional regulator [Chloroflexota bacterium]
MNPSYALLGLLFNGERHGYDLKQTVDREFAPFWRIDFAQLYRSFARMKQKGWIQPRVEPSSGGPDRKMYRLTPSGRKAFKAWLQVPAAGRDEFFVKLRLANAAGIAIDSVVATERASLESEHAERLRTLHAARDAGDAGRIVLADAAFRETEAALTALHLWTNTTPTPRGTPKSGRAPASVVITGSDDPLLSFLAQLSGSTATAVGSLTGLLILARHEADIAGVHLLDLETGEYNAPFVKHLMPEDSSVLVNLAFRTNGLMIAHGNPKRIRSVRDLARPDIRFINRQRGAGTRLLLFSKLCAAHVDPHALPDWEREVSTHEAVAAAVATGHADAGPGLEAVAAEWDLDFIQLGEERYDLAMLQETFDSGRLQPLLEALQGAPFRSKGAELRGYDLKRSGSVVARIKQ